MSHASPSTITSTAIVHTPVDSNTHWLFVLESWLATSYALQLLPTVVADSLRSALLPVGARNTSGHGLPPGAATSTAAAVPLQTLLDIACNWHNRNLASGGGSAGGGGGSAWRVTPSQAISSFCAVLEASLLILDDVTGLGSVMNAREASDGDSKPVAVRRATVADMTSATRFVGSSASGSSASGSAGAVFGRSAQHPTTRHAKAIMSAHNKDVQRQVLVSDVFALG